VGLALFAVLAVPQAARADGAFPDSLGILLPQDQPHRIMASTNFGLAVSDDDGSSWNFVCEEAIGTFATLYQVGPPPDDRLFAVTVDGVMESADNGCSWDRAHGAVIVPSDVFADPSDPQRVLVVSQTATDGGEPAQAVFESTDGGKSFDRSRFAVQPNSYITGVEIAQSDPQTVYVTTYDTQPIRPSVVRSSDGGASWKAHSLAVALGPVLVRILAVDPRNSDIVYLRTLDNSSTDQLAIYDDATGTARVALVLQHPMSAFLRRSDGALMVGTRDGGAYVSTDDGKSFSMLAHAPHLRALGERDGVLYAVADDTKDGFAVGASRDQGASWQALMRFEDIKGPLACGDLPSRCAIAWMNFLAALEMSKQDAGSPRIDAGAVDGGHRSGKRAATAGCGCRTPGSPEHERAWPWAVLGLLASASVLRRRGAARRALASSRRRLTHASPADGGEHVQRDA
jgi:MYXO-CTERM domain-containing protein